MPPGSARFGPKVFGQKKAPFFEAGSSRPARPDPYGRAGCRGLKKAAPHHCRGGIRFVGAYFKQNLLSEIRALYKAYISDRSIRVAASFRVLCWRVAAGMENKSAGRLVNAPVRSGCRARRGQRGCRVVKAGGVSSSTRRGPRTRRRQARESRKR